MQQHTPSASSASPASIAHSLRPTIDRGAAVLLVGSSIKERAQWVDQLVAHARAESNPPLILRVSAQSQELLADALTQVAEQSLEQLRAPGALYDESSCKALPALGGWLFRARSVRKSGILCVLEEVDTWLDRRGWPIESHESFAVLGALLEERQVRPVSIFCTVRSSDASGNPAIPAAVAALFDQRVTLNPAPTVVRDPSSVVAVLSGRSFTRASLAQTVTQWADLADDEAMVVFSSPLAPTIVPAAEVPVTQSNGANIEEPSLPWVPSVLPGEMKIAPAEPAAPVISTQWGHTLRAALEVRSALESLGSPSARRSTAQLEKAFVRSVSKLPLALDVLKEGAAQLDAQGSATSQGSTLLRRGSQAVREFDQTFSVAYNSAQVAWAAGATRPTMLHDVVASLHTMAAERAVRATAVLVLSGLRWDLWTKVCSLLLAQCPGLDTIHQGIHWAAKPLTTAMQKSLLIRGAAALGATPAEQNEPPAPRSLDEASQLRREHVGRMEIHRNTLYSLVFSEPELTIASAVSQTQERTVRALSTFVAGIPKDSLLLVAADVGSALPHGTGFPLTDGDVSSFEVLVPHTLFLWQ